MHLNLSLFTAISSSHPGVGLHVERVVRESAAWVRGRRPGHHRAPARAHAHADALGRGGDCGREGGGSRIIRISS